MCEREEELEYFFNQISKGEPDYIIYTCRNFTRDPYVYSGMSKVNAPYCRKCHRMGRGVSVRTPFSEYFFYPNQSKIGLFHLQNQHTFSDSISSKVEKIYLEPVHLLWNPPLMKRSM